MMKMGYGMNKLYFAGIGSRETEPHIMKLMSEIASILEDKNYILRSGHANGADKAFESGVKNHNNMNIFLPREGFNDGYSKDTGFIFIPDDILDENYCRAYESLKYHPHGYKMKSSTKVMMIRNFFQVHGLIGQKQSEFVICWTPNGELVGGTSQAIRLAKVSNIPVYNLAVQFVGWNAIDIVDVILTKCGSSYTEKKTTSLF